jgi:hypothetical protein
MIIESLLNILRPQVRRQRTTSTDAPQKSLEPTIQSDAMNVKSCVGGNAGYFLLFDGVVQIELPACVKSNPAETKESKLETMPRCSPFPRAAKGIPDALSISQGLCEGLCRGFVGGALYGS